MIGSPLKQVGRGGGSGAQAVRRPGGSAGGSSDVQRDSARAGDARAIFESAPHIVFDHIDPWIGDINAETTLFHIYNLAREHRHSLLLTMRTAPVQHNFALADLASIQGKQDEATSWLEKAVAANPDALAATLRLGKQYLRTRQPQKALTLARQFKFSPAPAPQLGEIDFHWQSQPQTTTNTP